MKSLCERFCPEDADGVQGSPELHPSPQLIIVRRNKRTLLTSDVPANCETRRRRTPAALNRLNAHCLKGAFLSAVEIKNQQLRFSQWEEDVFPQRKSSACSRSMQELAVMHFFSNFANRVLSVLLTRQRLTSVDLSIKRRLWTVFRLELICLSNFTSKEAVRTAFKCGSVQITHR